LETKENRKPNFANPGVFSGPSVTSSSYLVAVPSSPYFRSVLAAWVFDSFTRSRDAGWSTWTRDLLGLRRCLLTACLQPQMKTYRSPWCVSRTNHNI